MTGNDIKALRERLGIDQQTMAKLVGCYQHHIHRWESGEVKPGKKWSETFQMLDECKDEAWVQSAIRDAETMILTEIQPWQVSRKRNS